MPDRTKDKWKRRASAIRYNNSPLGKACKERYRRSAKRRAVDARHNAKRRSNPGYREWEAVRHQCRMEAKASGRTTKEVMAEWNVPQWNEYKWRFVDYSKYDVDETEGL